MNIYEYIENSQISYPFMSDSFLNTTVDNPTSSAEYSGSKNGCGNGDGGCGST